MLKNEFLRGFEYKQVLDGENKMNYSQEMELRVLHHE